jgi:hypothetical protein
MVSTVTLYSCHPAGQELHFFKNCIVTHSHHPLQFSSTVSSTQPNVETHVAATIFTVSAYSYNLIYFSKEGNYT